MGNHQLSKYLKGRNLKMANINIVTLGCKVNQYESEWMKEQLAEKGHKIVPFFVDADVVVVNTCTVTSESDRKSRQIARKVRKVNPNAKIVILGCSSQLNPASFSEFDFVGGNEEKKDIIKIIEKLMSNGKKTFSKIKKNYYLNEKLDDMIIKNFENKTRAFVKVEDGCDQFCTYCAIRLARGNRIRSKTPIVVIKEVTDLVKNGYKEIVLTGINLGKYGEDKGTNLIRLLKRLVKIEGNFRLRLSSLNPNDINDKLIDLFEDHPKKLCRHLHISLQSGSNRILKMMGRRYSINEFVDVVYKLRKIDPFFSITTDVIVGFPGENDEDFEQTLQLCSFVKFSKVHIFRFSPRKGTPAYELWSKNRVPDRISKERAKILNDHVNEMRRFYLREHIGKIRKVLIEMINEEDGRIFSTGFDDYYVPHFIDGVLLENTFVDSIPISVNKKGVRSRIACECERAMADQEGSKNFYT